MRFTEGDRVRSKRYGTTGTVGRDGNTPGTVVVYVDQRGGRGRHYNLSDLEPFEEEE